MRKKCSRNQLETYLRKNTQLAREHGNVLELLAFLLLQLVAVLRETVEQMVNNIGLEYAHAHRIGHFLGVALNLDVECQDDGVSVTWRRGRKKKAHKVNCQFTFHFCAASAAFKQSRRGLLCVVFQHNGGFHDIFLDDRSDADV